MKGGQTDSSKQMTESPALIAKNGCGNEKSTAAPYKPADYHQETDGTPRTVGWRRPNAELTQKVESEV